MRNVKASESAKRQKDVKEGKVPTNAREGQIWRCCYDRLEYRIDKIHSMTHYRGAVRQVEDQGYGYWNTFSDGSCLVHICDSGEFYLVYDKETP
jgi:hypothetical protein